MPEARQGAVAVSIVSHGHGQMVVTLIEQLLRCPEVGRITVTCNIPEELRIAADARTRIVRNPAARGFGANHNAAFRECDRPFLCVLNPDIELKGNPFPELLHGLGREGVALAAPRVLAPTGSVENSARRFPTLPSLIGKALGGPDECFATTPDQPPLFPDWVAGMFMLFRAEAFRGIGGFDDGFFLYYEDVDVCARLWQAGWKVLLCPGASVIHAAQRASHRNLRHMVWHLASMARYFRKSGLRLKRDEMIAGKPARKR